MIVLSFLCFPGSLGCSADSTKQQWTHIHGAAGALEPGADEAKEADGVDGALERGVDEAEDSAPGVDGSEVGVPGGGRVLLAERRCLNLELCTHALTSPLHLRLFDTYLRVSAWIASGSSPSHAS
mmetsp:Transcript_106728/g.189006  ORF Transcript_106728/g.189006 Transcript_106728/m.189006 type:complete len:125 (-) Transcript_106728:1388-1762(-)